MTEPAARVYVCEPEADQAKAIIALFRRWRPEMKITGVLFRDRSTVRMPEVDEVIRWEDLREADLPAKMIVPVGALSTRLMLQQCDVACGDALLARDALRVYDKLWLLRLAAEQGIPTPRTWQDLDGIDHFPVFYKQGFERGGGIRGAARRKSDLPEDPEGALIYQELIESRGTYGVAFVARDGSMLVNFTHFERHSVPAAGGSAVCIEQFSDPRLIELTERLLRITRFSGWGLAEFKYCPRRADYVLMEINAKFWASCEFAFVNEPAFARLLFNIDIVKGDVRKMVFLHRFVARGPIFMVRHVAWLWSAQLVSYGHVLRALALSLVPDFMLRYLMRFARGRRSTEALVP